MNGSIVDKIKFELREDRALNTLIYRLDTTDHRFLNATLHSKGYPIGGDITVFGFSPILISIDKSFSSPTKSHKFK